MRRRYGRASDPNENGNVRSHADVPVPGTDSGRGCFEREKDSRHVDSSRAFFCGVSMGARRIHDIIYCPILTRELDYSRRFDSAGVFLGLMSGNALG